MVVVVAEEGAVVAGVEEDRETDPRAKELGPRWRIM